MQRAGLDGEANLFDFFHEHVAQATRVRREELSEEGVLYLSNLLVERGRSEAEADRPVTLVELQLEAAHAPLARSIPLWRELGDKALYVLGFFRGSLERRGLGTDYYAHMGAAAYGRLSTVLAGPTVGEVGGHKSIDRVFAELAHGFDRCSAILAEVRQVLRAHVAQGDDSVLIELYEEYLRTGSEDLARQLRRLGLVLDDDRPQTC